MSENIKPKQNDIIIFRPVKEGAAWQVRYVNKEGGSQFFTYANNRQDAEEIAKNVALKNKSKVFIETKAGNRVPVKED